MTQHTHLGELKETIDTLEPNDPEKAVLQHRLNDLLAKSKPPPADRPPFESLCQALDAIPIAEVDEGTHKFILLVVSLMDSAGKIRIWNFVRSKDYAEYHYMAAEPLQLELKSIGVKKSVFEIPGGGRLTKKGKKISVFGESHQFGRAPMDTVVTTVKADPKYSEMEVLCTDD